jgi:hypothetical protein
MSKWIAIFACIFSMCVKPPAHVSVSDKSIETFAKTISSSSTKVLSIGGFYFQNKVENLYLDLEYTGTMSKQASKEVLINYIKGMVCHINQDQNLKPYLIKEAFDENDISVSLSYTDLEGRAAQVHLYNGEIIFSLYDKTKNQLEKTDSAPFFLK